MTLDAARLANPQFARLQSYDPGHDLEALRARYGAQLAELGGNENPYGPGPASREAIERALVGVYRYPDPKVGALRARVAENLGVAPAELVFGNGSHELLMQLGQAFAGPERHVLCSRHAFAVFGLAAAVAGAPLTQVPALPVEHPKAPLGHDLEAMAAAITEHTRLVYLANPNNPTGTWFEHADLLRFMQAVPDDVLVVADEAYAEFFLHEGGRSALELRARFPNLIVTRTFSKAQALAGLRIGYLVADAGVCRVLESFRENFSVGVIAQAAALASFDDQAWVHESLVKNREERARLVAGLEEHGFPCLPSRTNFVLVDCHGDAAPLERRLFDAGVVARPVGAYGLPGYLRVSVGSARENDRLLDVLT